MQVLALDVGTSSTKASLVDPSGMVKRSVSTRTAKLSHPFPGAVEVNPDEIYFNALHVLRQLAPNLKHEDVLISLSCMTPVLVALKRSGRPLRPAILYNDLRSWREVNEINEKFGIDRFLKINGNRASSHQWVPKLLWLRKHEKKRRIWKLFDLTTYLIWKLTGEMVIDHTVAHDAGLLNYSNRTWSDEILSFLKVSHESLPDLKPTTHTFEIKSEKIKSNLRLKGKQVTINAGCVDSVSSTIGLGAIQEGIVSFELGTTGIIYTPTRNPKPDRRLFLSLTPKAGLFFVGGATAASGAFYERMTEILLGHCDLKRANGMAAQSKPGSKGLIILPYLYGERTPIFDPFARTVIFGLGQNHDRRDLLRAAIEGIGYSFLHHIRIMQEAGYRIASGRLTGGGAKDSVWRQVMADVLGLPLTYSPRLAANSGTAYIGYVAAGMKKRWEDVAEWASYQKQVVPVPSYRKMYDELFTIYLSLYEKHKEEFKQLANICITK